MWITSNRNQKKYCKQKINSPQKDRIHWQLWLLPLHPVTLLIPFLIFLIFFNEIICWSLGLGHFHPASMQFFISFSNLPNSNSTWSQSSWRYLHPQQFKYGYSCSEHASLKRTTASLNTVSWAYMQNSC